MRNVRRRRAIEINRKMEREIRKEKERKRGESERDRE